MKTSFRVGEIDPVRTKINIRQDTTIQNYPQIQQNMH